LYGFTGDSLNAEGSITLPATFGTPPRQATVTVEFIIVRTPSAYNGIIGRGIINKLGAIPSTYHQMMKFPTSVGVGEVRGSQAEARRYYLISTQNLKEEAPGEVKIEEVETEEIADPRGWPGGETLSISLTGDPAKVVQIGASLGPEEREAYQRFLSTHLDVFAWEDEDLPGVDLGVITHRLNLDPGHRPVQQKKRRFAQERQEAIRAAVGRGLKSG